MQAEEFLVEEYKQIYGEIANYQKSYTQLENLVLGGAVAAYGFLLVHSEIAPAAWWIIPFAIGVSAVRCFGYYWIINKKLAARLSAIEMKIYGTTFVGYQTHHSQSRFGRELNIAFNMTIWAVVFIMSALVAFLKFGRPFW